MCHFILTGGFLFGCCAGSCPSVFFLLLSQCSPPPLGGGRGVGGCFFSLSLNGFIRDMVIQTTDSPSSRVVMSSDRFCILRGREVDGVAFGSSRFGRIKSGEDIAKEIAIAERKMQEKKARQKCVPVFHGENESTDSSGAEDKAPRQYRFNAKEVRRRAMAYALLRRSARFLAFYSISFPEGMPVDTAYRIWNVFLTRARRDFGLRSYLWVAELQKNGTPHFHMLTNDWLNVRDCNSAMAVTIDEAVSRGECSWGKSSFSRYNGVDVRRVGAKGRSRSIARTSDVMRGVSMYLAKYMAKQGRLSERRLWHCSRLVSALVTRADVCEAEMREILDREYSDRRKYRVYESEWCTFVFADVSGTAEYWFYIGRINDAIYDYFEKWNLF